MAAHTRRASDHEGEDKRSRHLTSRHLPSTPRAKAAAAAVAVLLAVGGWLALRGESDQPPENELAVSQDPSSQIENSPRTDLPTPTTAFPGLDAGEAGLPSPPPGETHETPRTSIPSPELIDETGSAEPPTEVETIEEPEPEAPTVDEPVTSTTPSDPGSDSDFGQSEAEESVTGGAEPQPETEPEAVVTAAPEAAEPDWEELARSIVLVEAPRCGWMGSGTVIHDGTIVLTNEHVAVNGSRPCDLIVVLTESFDQPPTQTVQVGLVVWDSHLDLAILQLVDSARRPLSEPVRPPIEITTRDIQLGHELVTLGYPGFGIDTVTLTRGDFSGTIDTSHDGVFWKTSAEMGPGISGGAAFDSQGNFVGVPTAGTTSELDCEGLQGNCAINTASLGLIRPSHIVTNWLNRALQEVSNG